MLPSTRVNWSIINFRIIKDGILCLILILLGVWVPFIVKSPLCGFTFSFRTIEVYFDIFIIHHDLVANEISENRFF